MTREEWIEYIDRLDVCARAASDRLSSALLDGIKFCRFSVGDHVVAFGSAYTVEEVKPVITTSKLFGSIDFHLYGRRECDKFSSFFALESQCDPLG